MRTEGKRTAVSVVHVMLFAAGVLLAITAVVNFKATQGMDTLCTSHPAKSSFFGKARNSKFDDAASVAYAPILREQKELVAKFTSTRRNFNLSSWSKQTDGGLKDPDRLLLAKIYSNVTSVFEYGVGESTFIADRMGIARYAGIDSHAGYLDAIRKQVNPHFRFYLADVGKTLGYGTPADTNLTKLVWDYQVAPLQSELQPFDVYLVDGRYRMACALLSFLHASGTGAELQDTIVLQHDCYRKEYHENDDILELVERTERLCVYKRMGETTDEQLLERWLKYRDDPV